MRHYPGRPGCHLQGGGGRDHRDPDRSRRSSPCARRWHCPCQSAVVGHTAEGGLVMLTVCVSASSTIGLAKTCELRDELGTSATSDDARMNRHILQATAWAEGIAGRPLRAQVY